MDTYKLNNETVDMLSEQLAKMYADVQSSKKEITRARLLMEELLLKYQSRFGEDIELTFRVYRVFGQYRFCVRLSAPAFDPFTLEENPMAFMLRSLLNDFEGNMPTWRYRNLENEIVFTARKKAAIGSLTKILLSALIALAAGAAARLTLPQDVLVSFAQGFVDPLADVYAGLFCVMAVLVSFFSICMSIVRIGDLEAVGALGGRAMRRYLLHSAAAVILLTLPVLPFFPLSGLGAFRVAAKSIYDILISFVPTNLVSPFLNFNSVHIMIIGAMFGFSLLTLGQKADNLVTVFSECNLVALVTNGYLNRFIFFYVALKTFTLTATQNFSQLASTGKIVAAILIAEAILVIFYTAFGCAKTGMRAPQFIRMLTPASLICLTSANLGAAFPTLFDSLFAYGMDGDGVNISANLGSIFFQPACTLTFILAPLFMADAYGIEISAAWLMMAILLAFVLVSAMPNVPGASVGVATLLFAQLGLPAEALSVMIALYAVLQFPTVAVDAWCLQSELFAMHGQKNEG